MLFRSACVVTQSVGSFIDRRACVGCFIDRRACDTQARRSIKQPTLCVTTQARRQHTSLCVCRTRIRILLRNVTTQRFGSCSNFQTFVLVLNCYCSLFAFSCLMFLKQFLVLLLFEYSIVYTIFHIVLFLIVQRSYFS